MQLYNESYEANSKYPLQDISEQLPFFCCPDHILDSSCQKDISKYIYCKEVGIPPHKGEYGHQPSIWIDKFWSIKQALDIRSNISRESAQREAKAKHGS